ncbi:ACT domain-containing protein [Shewanella surugensis]|uniref:ACT domain-containing protein n=1 Tax=Shewanella surugensis TaxID=212020 RepID=A0ABT0LDA8_9GAMM|nr:ACT domain-containing protein [Shewanella surugensis]MCL1125475.1 ACT domain-containing protein [Shewanella surugensis]
MAKMTLAVHAQIFCIHSFEPEEPIPSDVFTQEMYFIGKTKDEISIVVPEHLDINSRECEPGWRCIEVIGPLGFSMTGLLSKVSGILAKKKISIFAISTFDTDYILVKNHDLDCAICSLKKNQYHIIDVPNHQ